LADGQAEIVQLPKVRTTRKRRVKGRSLRRRDQEDQTGKRKDGTYSVLA
jgi:hypothetical protein